MKSIFCSVIWLSIFLCAASSCSSSQKEEHSASSQQKTLASALNVCENYPTLPIDTFNKYSLLAFETSKTIPVNSHTLLAHFYRARYYFNTSQYDSAEVLCDKIYEQLPHITDSLFVQNKTDALKGIVLFRKGQTKEAIDWFFTVIPRIEKSGNTEDIFKAYHNLGFCYMGMFLFDDAIRWFKKVIEAPELKNETQKAYSSLNIADCYANANQLDSAAKYAQIASEIGEINKLILVETNALNVLGKIYGRQGRHEESLEVVKKAMELRKQINDPYYTISDLIQLSLIYASMKHYEKGIAVSEEALKIAKDHNISSLYFSIGSGFWTNYYYGGQYQKAAKKTYELLTLLSKSQKTVNASAKEEVKYESDLKEQKIKEQKQELKIKNLTIFGSLLLLFLLILAAYFIYRNIRYREEQKLQQVLIAEQNKTIKAIINAEEKERSKISYTLHDGVGQLLSGLKMNLQALDERIETKEESNIFQNSMLLLEEAINEVRNVSHQVLPNHIIRIGLADALESLTEKLNNEHFQIHLKVNGNPDKVDDDVQLMIYRILQECINNATKHSQAQNLTINLSILPREIRATVKDDGIGFDINEIDVNKGIGLENIATRVRFLKGAFKIESTEQKGREINIRIPLSSDENN